MAHKIGAWVQGPGSRLQCPEIQPHSALMQLKVEVEGNILMAELPKDLCEEMNIGVGQKVFLILKLRSLRVH